MEASNNIKYGLIQQRPTKYLRKLSINYISKMFKKRLNDNDSLIFFLLIELLNVTRYNGSLNTQRTFPRGNFFQISISKTKKKQNDIRNGIKCNE